MNKEQYEEIKTKALKQIRTGKSVFGRDGALTPLLQKFLDEALDAEMEAHLNEKERSNGNKRNGRRTKTIKTGEGSFEISTPQDRCSTFRPQIVEKRQTILTDSLADKIIGMYGLGMSYRDISAHIEEVYDNKISHTVLSGITDRIIPNIKAWQNRPLEKVYCIVWLDAIHYKVREDGKIKHKALYNVLGINPEGKKEILGVYLSESEGAKFWLQVLTDLQNRGVEDILIACIDNLTGFSDAISSVFQKSEIQTCIVHQIRNSLKYVASKDQGKFLKDLKFVYKASTKDLAETALLKLKEKWGKKYPLVIKSWNNNWDKLSTYFAYSEPIRRLIYTTNPVEAYHRQIRKVTKTKGAFTNDMALLKLVYLATIRINEKWTSPIPNWSIIVSQLAIHFEGRLKLSLKI